MAILVTRPQPDNDTTTATLRARGLDVLPAPMLRFETVPFHDDHDAHYGAVIVTSANALRAIADQPFKDGLLKLPLFAVGERTAQAARDAGFRNVISADGDATALRDLMVERVKAKTLKKSGTLLYLAGADLARDLAGELGERGFNIVTHTAYRMAPVTHLPAEVSEAFAAGRIEAVLHYSRRSARAFFAAAGIAGVEISALAIPHCCLSDQIASVARDAGATLVMVAQTPDENALFAALDRAIAPISR
ncbi:MAG: uroporphyrinogen synthase [Tardiphaga sp.]|jgi:uroporphyrinogen-III synthase|uniref:uroporphyrinogen-III synthase n=1 Tax=Tardiphaga sp. TaxID=1926292 RepID=UPI002638EA38|nr:uroporphyrinogen-III synthase [Tardiphaga sp.]MDB5503424.1 uroporphyrinogen synthase [Tardiphaga sp.]